MMNAGIVKFREVPLTALRCTVHFTWDSNFCLCVPCSQLSGQLLEGQRGLGWELGGNIERFMMFSKRKCSSFIPNKILFQEKAATEQRVASLEQRRGAVSVIVKTGTLKSSQTETLSLKK